MRSSHHSFPFITVNTINTVNINFTLSENEIIPDMVSSLSAISPQPLFDPHSGTFIGKGWVIASVSTGSGEHETRFIRRIKDRYPLMKIAMIFLDPVEYPETVMAWRDAGADIVMVNPIFPSFVRLCYEHRDLSPINIYNESKLLSIHEMMACIHSSSTPSQSFECNHQRDKKDEKDKKEEKDAIVNRMFSPQQFSPEQFFQKILSPSSAGTYGRKFLDYSRHFRRLLHGVDMMVGWNLQYTMEIPIHNPRQHQRRSLSVNEGDKKKFMMKWKQFMTTYHSQGWKPTVPTNDFVENLVFKRYLSQYYHTVLKKSMVKKKSIPCFFFAHTACIQGIPQYVRGVMYQVPRTDQRIVLDISDLRQFLQLLSTK